MGKRLVFFLMWMVGLSLHAQTDFSETPLNIQGKSTNLDIKSTPKGTALKMPSLLEESPNLNMEDSKNNKNIKMLPDRELVQAGHGMKIDPKVGEKEKKGDIGFYGDMYLGDIKYSGKFVGIICRDHEYVDGDRIKIYANEEVVDPNFLLTGAFKGVNVDLEKGFNKIEFEALNQGSSGPNTAQIDVYDEQGKLLYSNRWNLSTGAKATFIVVKD
jgi:hypothetical protein